MTNFERVKAMTLEEMADFIIHETDGICSCCVVYGRGIKKCYNIPGMCEKGIMEWLNCEVET